MRIFKRVHGHRSYHGSGFGSWLLGHLKVLGKRMLPIIATAGLKAIGNKIPSKIAQGKPVLDIMKQTLRQTVKENARPMLNQVVHHFTSPN